MNLGTCFYMAPELVKLPEVVKKEKYDERVDVWALGVIAYLLIVRNYPFLGETEEEIFKQI